MTHLRPRHENDQGSILISTMVLMVLLSLSLLLVAEQLGSQKRSVNTRAFTRALFVADSGVQRAAYQAQTKAIPLPTLVGQSSAPVTESLEGGKDRTDSYTYTITRTGPRNYLIRSTGTAEGRDRTVTQEYVEGSLFSFAVFADKAIHFQGNGFVGSYTSNSNGSPSVVDVGNGNGNIGTNGALTSNGGVSANGVGLFNNDGGASCSGPVCDQPLEGFPRAAPFDIAKMDAVVSAELQACKNILGSTLPDYVASRDGNPGYPSLRAGKNCFRSMVLDAPVVPFPGSPTNPVTVYVDGGDIEVSTSDIGLGEYGPANAFQVYAINPATDVLIGHRGRFVGALWAPRSDCEEGKSTFEGVNVFGSMICSTFGKDGGTKGNGNFRAMYDNSLAAIGDGTFALGRFAEE